MTRLASIALVMILVGGCASAALPDAAGSDPVTRAVTRMTPGYERRSGGRVVSSELVPFESRIAGTKKWDATFEIAGRRATAFQSKILAEFPTGWLLMLSVLGDSADPDGLARNVLATLRAKGTDADCYWPVFRNMQASLGIDSSPFERPFRTAAAAGQHVEMVYSFPNMTSIFNNGVPGVC